MSATAWMNAAKLVLKNVGMAGGTVEEALARLNPDAAIELGREERARLLREVAVKLAEIKQETVPLETQLTGIREQLGVKKKAAAKVVELSKTPGAKLPSESAMQALLAGINKLNQDAEVLEARISRNKTAIDFLQQVVDKRAADLRNFDAEASDAKHKLEMANIRKEQASFTAELGGLAGKTATMAGIGALRRAAATAEAGADAAEIVAGSLADPTVKDDVMAGILREAEHGPRGDLMDELAKAAQQ